MRLVIVTEPPRLPLEDCEIAWAMIALYGRRPRITCWAGRGEWPVALAWLLVGVIGLCV